MDHDRPMLAIEITEPGGPDVLRLVERPCPRPGPGQVLLKVSAAGVNRPDLLQREGKYPPPPGASDIPGLEIAGEVVALGEEVSSPTVGDRVMALVSGGGYAHYCVAPAGSCHKVPAGFSMIDAAATPETWLTVWANVFEAGALAQGEAFLVHAGGSGIGTMAVQMAKAHGARVFATARGPKKCSAVERLGAERCFDSERRDFVADSRETLGGRGLDVVLDMLGGDMTQRNIQAMAPLGRIVQIATLLGSRAEVNLASIMQKRLVLTGSTLRARPDSEKARLLAAAARSVVPWFESGLVRPLIHMTFPLHDAAKAHQHLEDGHHIGKIVLTVG
jgi:putative PIG3 family NAD(P)H quinone oxidoreductase